MVTASQIVEHMEVKGSDGKLVGIVDHMEDADRIKLTKNDPAAQGKHHYIPLDWVDRVYGVVHLNKTSEDVKANWQTGA